MVFPWSTNHPCFLLHGMESKNLFHIYKMLIILLLPPYPPLDWFMSCLLLLAHFSRSWTLRGHSLVCSVSPLIFCWSRPKLKMGLSCLSSCFLSFCKWYSRWMMRIIGSVWKYRSQGFILDQHSQCPGRGWGDLYFYEASQMAIMNQPHLGAIGVGHILSAFFLCCFVLVGGLPAVCSCVTLEAP